MARKPSIPSRPIRRNMSNSLARSMFYQKSPRITRPGSVSPVEVITFMQEKDEEKLTEDWSNSLLYQKIANSDSTELAMTEQEMKVYCRKPPREEQAIKKTMEKGLNVLRVLLMELLGTKEDMQRFEERFKGNTPYHVRALMDRCLNLMTVRQKTLDLLIKVHKRESLLKNIKVSRNKLKEKILKVFCLNKEIRASIDEWKNDEGVPFDVFTFKGKDYLEKISEDSVMLQDNFDKIYNKCSKK